MGQHIKSEEFIEVAKACNYDVNRITTELRKQNPKLRRNQISQRLANARRKGTLPLDSGNKVSTGEVLRGSSTLYDDDNNVILQWVKTDVNKESQLEAISTAVEEIAKSLTPLKPLRYVGTEQDDSVTLYIANDMHFGMMAWEPETGQDWDLHAIEDTARAAVDYLVQASPPSNTAVIVDLGDIVEADDFGNTTPKSGNPLDVDSRYPKVLRAAYNTLIYMVQRALEKHETVHFLNVGGNHDMATYHAIREIMFQAFKNNPRVIVDESPALIKYLQFDKLLFQFFHGDCMKMKDAGEVMAVDCQDIFSEASLRFSHAGHNHRDHVLDTRICRVESHRNLPALNHWAHSMGYRRQLGTMKSITYDRNYGEISRNTYNAV